MNQSTSSCSMDAFTSISQPQEGKNQVYSREFQAMLDGLEEEDRRLLEEEECGNRATDHKKKRLSMDQVKALEKIFEVENKVEAERKVKLAEELGLQPRQVAIWFQNRRARSKTKQLEKDYAVLKANYDALKLDYDNLEQENDALTAKLRDMKAKQSKDHGFCDNDDGIVKEEISNVNAPLLMSSPSSCSFQFNGCSPSSDSSNHRFSRQPFESINYMYEAQLVKVEEQCMFSTAEECCNFFSVDKAPSLQWHFNGK